MRYCLSTTLASIPLIFFSPVQSLDSLWNQRLLHQLSHVPRRRHKFHTLHEPVHHSPPAVCPRYQHHALAHHHHRRPRHPLPEQCIQRLSPEHRHRPAWLLLRRLLGRIDLYPKRCGQVALRRPLHPRALQAGHLLQGRRRKLLCYSALQHVQHRHCYARRHRKIPAADPPQQLPLLHDRQRCSRSPRCFQLDIRPRS